MIPIQVKLEVDKLTNADVLAITWDDGHAGRTTLRSLRDNCPCAGCKGETVLLRTYAPAETVELPGKYKLVGAHQVGSYAMAMAWGDGHETGIYTWEHLRSLCECETCTLRNARG